jgi:hypothetical protein
MEEIIAMEAKMNEKLVMILEDRRLKAGRGNGKPLGYKAWGKTLGVVHTTLFRFARDERTLGIEALRSIAQHAKANHDNELLTSLAEYALNCELSHCG